MNPESIAKRGALIVTLAPLASQPTVSIPAKPEIVTESSAVSLTFVPD
jgi:hypothetical protein